MNWWGINGARSNNAISVGRQSMKRTMKSIALLIVIIPVIVLADINEPVWIKTGFITANDYREFTPQQKRAYAIGFMDGLFVAPFLSAPKSELSWVENCATGMTDYQVEAIFDKYLSDNPERWHESMNSLAWFAIKEGCKK